MCYSCQSCILSSCLDWLPSDQCIGRRTIINWQLRHRHYMDSWYQWRTSISGWCHNWFNQGRRIWIPTIISQCLCWWYSLWTNSRGHFSQRIVHCIMLVTSKWYSDQTANNQGWSLLGIHWSLCYCIWRSKSCSWGIDQYIRDWYLNHSISIWCFVCWLHRHSKLCNCTSTTWIILLCWGNSRIH